MTQVREAERIPFGHFAAGLIASDGVGSLGNRPYRKLSLVAAGGVMSNGSWPYYNSEVYAPVEVRDANTAAGYARWQVIDP